MSVAADLRARLDALSAEIEWTEARLAVVVDPEDQAHHDNVLVPMRNICNTLVELVELARSRKAGR